MITFLPADYKAPKANNYYMKLQDGENKFRILSRPIIGWEDWKDNKPIRFHMDQKPIAPVDPEKPIKHFWSCIVWNYNERQIQILHITQAGIRKAIEALCKDQDWGAPFFYDLKVIKKGDKMSTEYLVNPLPHKPVPEEVIKMFHDRPINLEALFTGEDPFSHLQDSYTPGIFKKDAEIELQPVTGTGTIYNEVKLLASTINKTQVEELTKVLSQCDDAYKKKVWNFWKTKYKIEKLDDLPADQYESIMKGALNHVFELAAKEG